MTTTPPEMLTPAEVDAELASKGYHWQTARRAFTEGARWAERALLAKLREQQPVAWAVGLPGEPIKQQALWSAEPSAEDVRFATTQGGIPLPALVVTPLYAAPVPTPAAQAAQAVPADAESFVRSLLWDAHPECCGCPCIGGVYMGQQEQVCCGQPEMDTLNDAQIVASLRERFPAAPTPTGAGDEGGGHA